MKLTRFETARILGARALQISLGAPPLVNARGQMDPLAIAGLENGEGVLPITVIRG